MNNSMNTTSRINAVIMSSYKYDDRLTDDNRAWYTVYTLYLPNSKKIVTIEEGTGFGDDIFKTDYNIVGTRNAYADDIAEILEKNRQAKALADYARYTKELDEYNASLRPQSKGQKVEILAGRRKGVIGTISWIGKGKTFGYDADAWYRKAYPMAAALVDCINHRPYTIPAKNDNLIRVWPVDGSDPFYIAIDKAKVIEGFVPVTITLDDAYKFNVDFNESFMRKWNNGYDAC